MPPSRLLLLLLVILSLPLSGGCQGRSANNQAPVTLRLGMAQQVISINPVYALEEHERQFFFLVYETLFERGPQGEIRPYLAQDWEYTPDGAGLRITLHSSTWHDGTPLTAEDVAFSLNLYRQLPNSPLNEFASVIQSVQVLDEHSLLIQVDRPRADLTARLANLFIIPRHIWEPLGTGNNLRLYNNAEMIGSGPLRLTAWSRFQFLRFQSLPDHWKYRLPFDELICYSYDSEEQMLQDFRKGELDVAAGIHSQAEETLQGMPNLLIVHGPGRRTRVWDVIINQIDPSLCPEAGRETCRSHPALRDVNVRRALAYATPKQQLIDDLLGGWGRPGLTLIPPVDAWYASALQDVAYDLAAAKRLLDAGGYVDIDADGVREMPDGVTELDFELAYPAFKPAYEQLAALLIPYWQALGIRLTPRAIPQDELGWYVNPSFEHDLVLWGWTGDLDPDKLLSLATTAKLQTIWSESGYSNPAYDALYEAQTVELDPARRQSIVWQMQEILLQDVVYIILFYEDQAYAANASAFSGWGLQENVVNPFSIHTLMGLRVSQ